MRRARFAAGALAAVLAYGSSARAGEDGAAGRLEGDLHLELGAGAAFADGGPALAVNAGVLYLGTAGIYGHYTDALGSDDPTVERSIATGASVRPLFLARYASDLEHGPAHLDLLVDSITFGVGAFWDSVRGRGLGAEPGLELALSFAVPILPSATGPFVGVRTALRWRDADLGGRAGGFTERGALITLTLAWHQVIAARVVDAGDGLAR